MPIITIIECEKPCGHKIEIVDDPTQEQAQEQARVIQVTLANGKKYFFHCAICFKTWASNYKETPLTGLN